jgi:cobalt-precorrin 5A hydrolase
LKEHGNIAAHAVWVVTPNGIELSRSIRNNLAIDQYCSRSLESGGGFEPDQAIYFDRLSETVAECFHRYNGHIFVMSTGIVVRVIAPIIRKKTEDPAVVVVDDRGKHAISLIAGHLGGANKLARRIAGWIGAEPVITTATDVNEVPAIDSLAVEKGLSIENPGVIKSINMAFLTRGSIYLYDPYQLLIDELPEEQLEPVSTDWIDEQKGVYNGDLPPESPAVFVSDVRVDLPPQFLVLRPGSLVAGIGCNRNTSCSEIKELLQTVLDTHGLAIDSLARIASVNIKNDEPGLIALADDLDLPLAFYSTDELEQVQGIRTPSTMVKKHIGVQSVCEAAAILASEKGQLIVPKHKTQNVTVAIARIPFS